MQVKIVKDGKVIFFAVAKTKRGLNRKQKAALAKVRASLSSIV